MNRRSFLKAMLCVIFATLLFVQPIFGINSEAAATKNLLDLNCVQMDNAFNPSVTLSKSVTALPSKKTYATGDCVFFTVASVASVTYNLNKKYIKLTGLATAVRGTYGSRVFDLSFYGDGKLLKNYSGISVSRSKNISVNVTGVKKLQIIAGSNATTKFSNYLCIVNPRLSLPSFKVSSTSLVLGAGEKKTLKCTKTDGRTAKATFKTSDRTVANVNSKTGLVAAKGVGTCTITCTVGKEKITVPVTVKPYKVTGLKTNSVTTNSVEIAWDTQPNASGYKIYLYDEDVYEYSVVKQVKKGSVGSAVIKGLNPNTSYKFKVRSYLKNGSKNYTSDDSSVLKVKTKK